MEREYGEKNKHVILARKNVPKKMNVRHLGNVLFAIVVAMECANLTVKRILIVLIISVATIVVVRIAQMSA